MGSIKVNVNNELPHVWLTRGYVPRSAGFHSAEVLARHGVRLV